MRRISAFVTALVCAVALLPATATGTERASDRPTHDRHGQLLALADRAGIGARARGGVVGAGEAIAPLRATDPAERIRVARAGASDAHVALRALALAAEQAGGSGLVVAAPRQTTISGSTSGSALVFSIGPQAQGLDVGDLDGDGTDDLVTPEFSDAGITLRALRGIDGEVLWVAAQDPTIGGALLSAIPDVDGDGRRDVLATSLEYGEATGSGECTQSSCSDRYEETLTSHVSLLSGATGTALWQTDIEGRLRQEFEYDSEGQGQSGRFEYVDYGVTFLPAGDLDGDGAEDLVSVRSTVTSSFSSDQEDRAPGVSSSEESADYEGDTTVLLIDGAHGTEIAAYEELDRDSSLFASPIPDVTGDGVADLLAQRSHGSRGTRSCTTLAFQTDCEGEITEPRTDVLVIDGAGQSVEWTEELGGSLGYAVAPGDLTEDGSVDVVTSAVQVSDDGQVRSEVAALDGVDGTELWRRDRSGDTGEDDIVALALTTPIAVTELDEEPGGDLLLSTLTYVFDLERESRRTSLTVARLNGRSGATLLETERTSDSDSLSISAASPAQADGDGSADLLITTLREGEDSMTLTSEFEVESGRTGAVLASREFDRYVDARVLGDVDGDGTDEGVLNEVGFPPPSGAAAPPDLEVFDLDTGAIRWTRPMPTLGGLQARGAGDLNGTGGLDVVVEGVTLAGDGLRSLTAARVGDDGRLLWSDPPIIPLERVQGDTRIATAIALSARTRAEAATVVIARADDWPDAITGGPLAGQLGGALLLTGGDALSPAVGEEIQRLGATTAVLLGGEAALSEQVAADLRARGLTVERLAGGDRFETAALIAGRIATTGGDATEVSLVRGTHPDPTQGWSDAVIAAARGAADGHPILLTDPETLPTSTRQALGGLGVARALVLGGTGAVSAAIEQEVRDTGITTQRLAGSDRYSTAQLVAEQTVTDGLDPSTVWIATGAKFPDALAASAATATGGVLLLTTGVDEDPGTEVLFFIGSHRDAVDRIVLIGGPAALSPVLEARVRGQFSD